MSHLSAFDYPSRVMERLTLEKFLSDIRESVPAALMPSAVGISKREFCSKPEYLTTSVEEYIRIGGFAWAGSGYFANDTGWEHRNEDTGVYLLLNVNEFMLLCHLKTDKCWVAVHQDKVIWEPWRADQTLPVDVIEYKDKFDCYV